MRVLQGLGGLPGSALLPASPSWERTSSVGVQALNRYAGQRGVACPAEVGAGPTDQAGQGGGVMGAFQGMVRKALGRAEDVRGEEDGGQGRPCSQQLALGPGPAHRAALSAVCPLGPEDAPPHLRPPGAQSSGHTWPRRAGATCARTQCASQSPCRHGCPH